MDVGFRGCNLTGLCDEGLMNEYSGKISPLLEDTPDSTYQTVCKGISHILVKEKVLLGVRSRFLLGKSWKNNLPSDPV